MEILNYDWKVPSETGSYSFNTNFKFANFPSQIFNDGGASGHWTQACKVQVDEASFLGFTAANNETNTTAAAHLLANGTKTGDCGSKFTFSAVLTDSDGNSQVIKINENEFFSEAGQTIDQDIARELAYLNFSVKVKADDAQTAAEHQAMTVSTGYHN